jgi:hypothetical protein
MFKISKFLLDYTVSQPTRQFFIITVMRTAFEHNTYRGLSVARSCKCLDCNQFKSLGVNNGETVYENVLCLSSPFKRQTAKIVFWNMSFYGNITCKSFHLKLCCSYTDVGPTVIMSSLNYLSCKMVTPGIPIINIFFLHVEGCQHIAQLRWR